VGFDLAAWSLTAACWKDLVEQPVSCMQLITYLIVGVALLVIISTFLFLLLVEQSQFWNEIHPHLKTASIFMMFALCIYLRSEKPICMHALFLPQNKVNATPTYGSVAAFRIANHTFCCLRQTLVFAVG
jgi:uncharacterized membrane protein (DUF4010 family)